MMYKRMFKGNGYSYSIAILVIIIFVFGCHVSHVKAQSTDDLKSIRQSFMQKMKNCEYNEAFKQTSALVNKYQDNADIRALHGLAALKMGIFSTAEREFDQALALDPKQPEAFLGKGKISFCQNKLDLARELYFKALQSELCLEEVCLELSRTYRDLGDVKAMRSLGQTIVNLYKEKELLLPGWVKNSMDRLDQMKAERIFDIKGKFDHITVPLKTKKESGIRMVPISINGQGPYYFDIDSATKDIITISPLLAESLKMDQTGEFSSVGVGTNTAISSTSVWIDEISIGGLIIRDIPATTMDSHTFKGEKKGLIGTGFLKHFNCTIDTDAATMSFYPLMKPELMYQQIDDQKISLKSPIYIYNSTVVPAKVSNGDERLFILDTAAGGNLLDHAYFKEFLEHTIDSDIIRSYNITGAGGTQKTDYITAITVSIGPVTWPNQGFALFPMSRLNNITKRYAAGLVGYNLLWDCRVHLDFSNPQLILEKL